MKVVPREETRPQIKAASETTEKDPGRGRDGAPMVLVPAGEFLMGSEVWDHTMPVRRVYLDAFYIDTYEVTNALYQRFMQATGRQAPASWHNSPNQPVVGVSWHAARAYCQWADKRLPTEAEWEKAARGTDGRTYPWGNQWHHTKVNTRLSGKLGKPTPVGSYEADRSPYGVYDMAGNVGEWVARLVRGQLLLDRPQPQS